MRFGWAFFALALIASPALADMQNTGAMPAAVATAGVTQDQWNAIRAEVSRQARRANISEAALMAAAEAAGANLAGSGDFSALALQQAIFEQLANQADQIAELQHRLDALTGDSDPEIAHIYTDARTALDEGRLADADRLLAQASERDLAALRQADAEAERRRLRAGETIAARGQVAYLQADYLNAASFYARAVDTVPQSAIPQRWRYVCLQADAFRKHGELFNENEHLHEAVRLYRDAALPLAPRDRRPDEWAATQNDMGTALETLGERGDDQALGDALVAYRAALEILTRERDPTHWASAQNNLGNVLEAFGERGDDSALREAITAFRAALEVNTREENPTAWARDQNNLGSVLEALGERGDDEALRDAVSAFRMALEIFTRESDPVHWASAQSNMAAALEALGERGDGPNRGLDALHDAIVAVNAALEVDTREHSPAAWARDQYNLGLALKALGQRGDIPDRGVDALYRAISAFQAALEVFARARNAEAWARVQQNLGETLGVLGTRLGDDAALRAAVAAFRNALEVQTRQHHLSDWAQNQSDLALTLGALSEHGDRTQLPDALTAAQAALDGFTQIGFTEGVARMRYTLSLLERQAKQ